MNEPQSTAAEELLARLQQLAPEDFAAALADVRPQTVTEFWDELSPGQQEQVLTALSREATAELISNLPEEEQARALQALTLPEAAAVLEELSPDDLADMLQALDAHAPEDAEALKTHLDPETRAVVDALTGYDGDAAGGLMTPEFISVRATMTVEQVLAFIRRVGPEVETIYNLYAVDNDGRLQGVMSLRQLLVSAPGTRVEDIMDRDVIAIGADVDQEEVAQIMGDYDFSVLPVVDDNRCLIGIITIDDVLDVVAEEATEDIHRLGAAPIDIDYVHASPWLLFRKRASWLVLLVVSMTLTFNVISRYEAIIEELVILAAFIPLLIGTGGNVGAQVATMVVRSLATRELNLRDYLRVIRKETATGLMLGLAFGAFMTAYVMIFRSEPRIAIALGITMVLISFTANLVGATLPFLFRRFGIDPALTSSPGITTVMDVLGLLIYFQVVMLIMHPLLGD